ncbi:MAG: T9SS type A sorting domain-containing protein, partial [Cyclobacteriaceae bacterium]
VPNGSYAYTDYVNVPFEVWDVTNNRQLMACFRDQGRNGTFDLNSANTEGPAIQQSREYLYVNNVTYDANAPHPSIAVNGGHEFSRMYFIWPTLAAGGSFPPSSPATLRFQFTAQTKLNANTSFITDGRGQYGDPNRNAVVHVDHHNLVAIPLSGSSYKILNANDGGVAISNVAATPGIGNNTWTSPGITYNTSQFYGADKRPGRNQFIGGTQDNGTWVSQPNVEATATTTYNFAIGGDGFEAIWHNSDDRKLIGGFQGNGFRRSVDGGLTWTNATSGLSGSAPFISKLANSRNNPEVIFTLSSAGVFRSPNFGASWTLTPIATLWGPTSSTMDVEVSRANANIVWAGSRISSNDRIHVSTNGGQTFSPTANYTVATMGAITKLGSHPTEPNTAYAIFSFRGRPKILRTTNLGTSWQDITGFGSGSTSINGFPDVAVYCIYVRPDNTNIIWVGTEIGIVQSLDGGTSWALLDDFPNISVWDMKGLDNQVIIATHGRGIWTATVDQNQLNIPNPAITTSGTTPRGDFAFKIKLDRAYDSVQIRVNQTRIGKIQPALVGEYIATIRNVPIGTVSMEAIGFVQSTPATSSVISGTHFQLALPVQEQYFDYFQTSDNWRSTNLFIQALGGDNAFQTPHNYSLNTPYSALLRKPIKVRASEAKVYYRDVALVEPGLPGSTFPQPEFKDYVVLEATKNGVDWLPISPGYDATRKPDWQTAFAANTPGSRSLMQDQVWEITPVFAPNDTLLFRFRMFSDGNVTGWGWALDDLYIQQVPTGLENSTASGVTASPNPTSGEVTISYQLATAARVQVEVLSPVGQSVMSVDRGVQDAGRQETKLSLRGSAGVYLVRVSAGGQTAGVLRVVLR